MSNFPAAPVTESARYADSIQHRSVVQMAKKKSRSSSRESLVVGSKVKAYIRKKGFMCSSELLPAASEKLYQLLDEACTRTKSNRRGTVRPTDL